MIDFNNVRDHRNNGEYMITGADILQGICILVLILLIAHFEAVL